MLKRCWGVALLGSSRYQTRPTGLKIAAKSSAAFGSTISHTPSRGERLGSRTSTERTTTQTETGKFYSANMVLQLREALMIT